MKRFLYRVEGADKDTGKNRTVVFEEDDEKSAAKCASTEHNLYVHKIKILKTNEIAPVVLPKSDEEPAPVPSDKKPWHQATIFEVDPKAVERLKADVRSVFGASIGARVVAILMFIGATLNFYFCFVDAQQMVESMDGDQVSLAAGLSSRFVISNGTNGLILLGLGVGLWKLGESKSTAKGTLVDRATWK